MSVVTNLEKKYSDFILRVPRWEIADKGVSTLMGPSGSGKTTLFRVLLGLEPCDNYQWLNNGVDLAKLSPSERNIGVVFQTYDLFPHMTAEQNILFSAEAKDMNYQLATQRLNSLSEKLQISKILQRSASVLSGGEKQRVALARALIAKPSFLFLDEPFSALDTELRQESRELVKNIIAAENIPVILITHDREDVAFLSDRVARIENGQLIEN